MEPEAAASRPSAGAGARIRRRLRSRGLDPILRMARRACGLLSWRTAQRLGDLLGRVAWLVARRDRKRTLEHLAIAFPELSDAERVNLGRRSFRHLLTSALEVLHLWGRPPEESTRHVTVEGFDVVDALRADGRPILVLMGHCGNWELTSTANLSHGLGLAAMAREVSDAPQLAEDLRSHFGSVTLPRGDRRAISGMLRVLRKGGTLAMLIDQDIRTDGVWVPFFGKLAHTSTAAAELALRLGAAVVPTFCERLDDGSHLLCFHPPLDLPDDVVEATACMTAAIEAQIRRRPEQWVWMHKRWRRRPPGEEVDGEAISREAGGVAGDPGRAERNPDSIRT